MRLTGDTSSLHLTRRIKMYTRLFGWLTLLGIIYTTMLYFMNLFIPTQTPRRVNTHCIIGKLTIVTLVGHLLTQPIMGYNDNWVIWSGLGLYLIIIASGVILLYLPESGGLRYHARSIHSALVVGLIITIFHHVLTRLDLL